MSDRITQTSIFHYIGGALVVSAFVVLAYYNMSFNSVEVNQEVMSSKQAHLSFSPSDQSAASVGSPAKLEPFTANEVTDTDVYLAELIETLHTNHADEQGDILFHVRLKDIYEELIANYPAQGQVYFSKVIKAAFPEFADTIFSLIEKLLRYDEWLLQNLPDLNQIDVEVQQDQIWQKRFELFGKQDAEKIWNQELSEEDIGYEAVLATVSLLHKSHDMEMEQRIKTLMSTYEQHYSALDELIVESKGVILQTILGLDAVQQDLSSMTPEERQQQINEVRRSLKFSEEDIAYLETQDQKSERDWQNGYAYMEERTHLVSQYKGSQLDTALNDLRVKYFQNRSETIRKEEEDIGFFRYTRDRLYGIN